MEKFELYGGMFLDWEGRGELQMEHGMGSGKDNYDRGGGGRWEGEMGGGSGRTNGKGWRGRRWQGDEERGTGRGVRELSPEVGREGNVWGEEMAPPLQLCAWCVLLTASEH